MEITELSGMSGDPPYPVQIAPPGANTFREGYVLRIETNGGKPWVGNFQCGAGSYCGFLELHTERVAVVAGGQGYVVDAIRRSSQHVFGGDVTCLLPIQGSSDFLAIANTDVARHSSTHMAWRSKRIAWDGISQTQVKAGKLVGKARHFDDTWYCFEVDLSTGKHTGGAYEGEA